MTSRGWYEFYGRTGEWNHALTCCYTPLSSTFIGLDSFSYVFETATAAFPARPRQPWKS
jgi:hypothetical protein